MRRIDEIHTAHLNGPFLPAEVKNMRLQAGFIARAFPIS